MEGARAIEIIRGTGRGMLGEMGRKTVMSADSLKTTSTPPLRLETKKPLSYSSGDSTLKLGRAT